MKLASLIARRPVPKPWSEGDKIPWHEAGFSRRMLAEHLTQAHDRASRRLETIDAQVEWIHEEILEAKESRILDLGCGPGLYEERLCALGHSCVGVDISPASIEHARASAKRTGVAATFFQEDLRSFEPLDLLQDGAGFDLAMLLFGEANVFRASELEEALRRAAGGLAPGGRVLLEPHVFTAVRAIGATPPSWYTAQSGLFSDAPHLCLHEAFWDEERAVATERWWIVDLESGETTAHAQSMQAYEEDSYRALLERAGFEDVQILPGVGGAALENDEGLCAIVARRAA